MFAVLTVIAWALGIGLTARRFGLAQEVLLLVGIVAVIAIQYFIFGPS